MNLYAVAFNESLDVLQNYQNESGHPGAVARPVGSMIRDFRVLSQSTIVAIDANGVITYRTGYGRKRPSEWAAVFQELAESAQ